MDGRIYSLFLITSTVAAAKTVQEQQSISRESIFMEKFIQALANLIPIQHKDLKYPLKGRSYGLWIVIDKNKKE